MAAQSGILIHRSFVEQLKERLHEDAPLIQVILGPRQVGKTTGILQLAASFPKGSIHYASADDILGRSSEWIDEQWQLAKLKSSSPLLILDEIQKILSWSEKVKSLWDQERRKHSSFKLVLLGSSSLKLRRGIEESLAGRFEVIAVPHWSFQESKKSLGYSLEDYLLLGGYPAALQFRSDFTRWHQYLHHSIIETVIGKDILNLATVKNPALFRQTFELITSLPAQVVSYTKLLGQIQEHGNTDLVKHYIELFEGAFLIRALQKYSGTLLRQKVSSPKILPLCPALCTYQLSSREELTSELRGHIFEVIVGAELVRLSGQLFYWREGDDEVDYVYKQGAQLFAIEVKSGRKKSTRGLKKFKEAYPKAHVIFVSPENFEKFSGDVAGFLKQVAF